MSNPGFTRPPAVRVSANMEPFEANLLKKLTPFRFPTLDEGCLALAKIHGVFLLIHPLREGNGRTAHWLADLICLEAGLPQVKHAFVGEAIGFARQPNSTASSKATFPLPLGGLNHRLEVLRVFASSDASSLC